MKTTALLLLLSVPACAGTLEADSVQAAAPFEGLAAFSAGPAVDARGGSEPARPALAAPEPAPKKRPRTFDDGFMDGFGFVETPAVELISANMSSCRNLCSGNPVVGAVGYGLGLLLWIPAAVAGLATAAWWAVFG